MRSTTQPPYLGGPTMLCHVNELRLNQCKRIACRRSHKETRRRSRFKNGKRIAVNTTNSNDETNEEVKAMNPMYSLRRLTAATSVALALVFSGAGLTHAADKTVSVGITLPLTGADAEDSARVRDGFLMSLQEANETHAIPGYTINPIVYDTA